MLISVNDTPEMRTAFSGLATDHVDITYTVGGGRRGGAKRRELIIRNW